MRRNHLSGLACRCSQLGRSHSWALAAISLAALSVIYGQFAKSAYADGPQADFFVAVDGNDAWTGTLPEPNAEKSDGPFATISRARDAVRAVKAKGPLTKPVTVMVREGTYYLSETLVFGPEDSGTKDCPVSYVAYPGETPVVSGGRVIAADWKPYQGKIQVCVIPEVKQGKWYFRQLSVNGKRQKRSRTPDEGEYLREDALSETSFKFSDGHMQKWHNLDDVEVLVFHSWNESRFRIASLDETNRVVQFRDPKARHTIGWKGAGGPNRYYIENTLEGVTEPGEWYLDRQTGRTVLLARGGRSGRLPDRRAGLAATGPIRRQRGRGQVCRIPERVRIHLLRYGLGSARKRLSRLWRRGRHRRSVGDHVPGGPVLQVHEQLHQEHGHLCPGSDRRRQPDFRQRDLRYGRRGHHQPQLWERAECDYLQSHSSLRPGLSQCRRHQHRRRRRHDRPQPDPRHHALGRLRAALGHGDATQRTTQPGAGSGHRVQRDLRRDAEHQRRRRDLHPRLEHRDQQQPDPRRLRGRRAMSRLGHLPGLRDARHEGDEQRRLSHAGKRARVVLRPQYPDREQHLRRFAKMPDQLPEPRASEAREHQVSSGTSSTARRPAGTCTVFPASVRCRWNPTTTSCSRRLAAC